jgi:hypothetical protein
MSAPRTRAKGSAMTSTWWLREQLEQWGEHGLVEQDREHADNEVSDVSLHTPEVRLAALVPAARAFAAGEQRLAIPHCERVDGGPLNCRFCTNGR